MPAVAVPVVAEVPAVDQELESRAAAQREKCRVKKQKQRARFKAGLSPVGRRGGSWDPADYAEEWDHLTRAWRMRSAEIIKRSQPSYSWFKTHVLPLVHESVCASCDQKFNPQLAGSLVRCSKTCGCARKPVRP